MNQLTAPAGVPSPPHPGDLHPLAATLLALRSTRDAGTACAIAASCAAKALDAMGQERLPDANGKPVRCLTIATRTLQIQDVRFFCRKRTTEERSSRAYP